MTASRPAPLALALALVAAACAAPAAEQRSTARPVDPAAVTASPAAAPPLEPRVYRLRAYADEGFRLHHPSWQAAIVGQLQRANAVLEPALGVRLALESVRAWDRGVRPPDLAPALAELAGLDAGAGVDWVVGWVGPHQETTSRDALGLARPFSRHFVLRSMRSPQDGAGNAGWGLLSPRERAEMADRHRAEKETSSFLHEWAHTLGAVHECPGTSLMSREYSLGGTRFSPESSRIVRLGLRRHGASTAADLRAWAAEYHEEAARMGAACWECGAVEEALASQERCLATLASAAERPPAPEQVEESSSASTR